MRKKRTGTNRLADGALLVNESLQHQKEHSCCMADIKLTLVVACALVDADKRVLLAQRPEGKVRWRGCGNSPAARSSPASGRNRP
ncbi:hypothetical protein ACVWY2_006096 [Bradyrhizobium sp. JR6.1]